MAGLGGIGAFGSGLAHGMVNGQQLREGAMRLKMQQLQLDDEKRRLMGEAALFAHISGLNGQGPDPGQPPQGGMGGMGQQQGQPQFGGGMNPDGSMSLSGGGQPPTSPNAPGPGPVQQQAIPPPWGVGDPGTGTGQAPPNPYAAPQGGGPGGAPAMPPGAASQPAQPPMQPQGGQPGPQAPQPGAQPQPPGDGLDIFSQYKSVLQIANDIQGRYMQANGGKKLDSATLLSATERAIKLMQGLTPAQRLAFQPVLQTMKDQAAQGRVDTQQAGQTERVERQQQGAEERVSEQQKGAGERTEASIAGRAANVQTQQAGALQREREVTAGAGQREAGREATVQRGQDITSGDRKAAREASMARAEMVQKNLNQRFTTGAGDKTRLQAQLVRSREIVAQMNAAQRIMNGIELAKPGVTPESDQQYAAAVKSYEDASNKLDILEKQSQTTGSTGAPQAGTPKVGDIITGRDGKRYKVTGGDPNDPDVEEVP